MKKTSLYDKHFKLEAKILDYAGYLMPINYKNGIQHEYHAVRNNVGLFDVSHMGEIFINGPESQKLLSLLTVNEVENISNNQAQYTALCNDLGGVIDDVILYKLKNNSYLLIVNASNLDNVFNWMIEKNNFNCNIYNKTDDYSLLALQGPNSRLVLEKILNKNINLKFYYHDYYEYKKQKIFISRTGYTGELGFEILANHDIINYIWDDFLANEAIPCGLAVRDLLRLEMKYCLYGNDINEKITPIQAGLKWIVNNKQRYFGKDIIEKQLSDGVDKQLICIKMLDKAIPRTGYEIFANDEKIGKISSGSFSLNLKTGIAMAYIKSKYIGSNKLLDVKIRNKYFKGEIVKPPFIKNFSLHK